MEEKLRKSGIDLIGDTHWGAHFCQFYQTKEDLIDILVPYFKAGLENNEFCTWITSDPLSDQEAKEALQKAVPSVDGYLKQGQIEIIPYTEWYTKDGSFDSERVLNGWLEKLNQALEKGYEGLRITGNTFCLEKGDWNDFVDYEKAVNNVIGQYQMIALCTYSLDKCSAAEVIDVVNNHEFALIKREGKWALIESSEHRQMEKKLWESKKRYKQFFNNPLNGFALCEIITDNKGEPVDFVYLKVNKAFEDFTGLKKEEVINKRVKEVFPPEDVVELIKIYGNVALTGESKHFEHPIHSLGKDYDIVAFSPQKMRFIAVFTDITEHKKAEEEHKRHDKLLDGINGVFQEVLITETEEEVAGKCLEVAEELTGSEFGFLSEINPAGRLGTLALSPLALKSFKISPGKAREMINNMEIVSYWGRTIKEERSQIVNEPESDVDRRGFPEGHPKIISFLGVPLKQGNKTIGMIALANKEGGYTEGDVENIEALSVAFVEALMRKRAEIRLKESYDVLERRVKERTAELEEAYSSLKESENKFRTLAENSPDLIIRVDRELNYLYVSPTVTKFTDKLPKLFIGKNIEEIATLEEYRSSWKEEYQKAFETGKIQHMEFEVPTTSGLKFFERVTVPEYKDEGEIESAISISRDITERKEAKKKLEELVEELKRSNEELQRFAYVASHDLQEPLRTISSFTQLLERRYHDKLDNDADEFIEYVVEAAQRMQQMIRDLLDYSRIMTEGKKFGEVNSENVLKEVISSLKTIIDENSAIITYGHLPMVIADESQIRRVFQNLIVNAIKFRKPDEPPKIHISCQKDEKREEFVFNVSDNGIGIDEQYFKQIFTIFQRLHTRKEYQGTGIGLSVVERIIERHGGYIWVESEPEVGSKFYFTIPFNIAKSY